jgi:hypothetical protein
LPSHETRFDLANSLHPARYRDSAVQVESHSPQRICRSGSRCCLCPVRSLAPDRGAHAFYLPNYTGYRSRLRG